MPKGDVTEFDTCAGVFLEDSAQSHKSVFTDPLRVTVLLFKSPKHHLGDLGGLLCSCLVMKVVLMWLFNRFVH